MISALAAAKEFGRLSGWGLSNLELQKLIYIAHMIYLGRTGKPLVSGPFQAWDYGPVNPTLYHRAKVFGRAPVEDIFGSLPPLPEGAEKRFIQEAYESLGALGPSQLVSITHRTGGAWEANYRPGRRYSLISNEDIRKEYESLDVDQAA
ncbi:Panacea domain-containing protein [Paracoccus isoporae]|uniref:Panacea domain-containing protein n=1 Tax=Paracoccus isoporae TaxID=591205 RepID=UPI000B86F21A|nr:type II toxin-antitoxin system antitoxin SocA domain-containing protein [Paracoccus isoporae]